MDTRYAIFSLVVWQALNVFGHVPYLEETDYTPQKPFFTLDVTQSIAVYAWLESPADVDVYVCWVRQPTRLFAELLVPVCGEYKSFYPALAVLGPGLPPPAFSIGGGYLLHPVLWTDRSLPRETFFEPFGNKSYFQGPSFDATVTIPGLYIILCWDPERMGGDYVLPIGYEERWPPASIVRALINTPKIRENEELHTPCSD